MKTSTVKKENNNRETRNPLSVKTASNVKNSWREHENQKTVGENKKTGVSLQLSKLQDML